MLDVVYDKKTYLLPEEYNELSGRQLIEVAAVFHSKDDALVKQLKVLRILLQYSLFIFFKMPAYIKEALLPFTHFIFEKNGLTRQLLPCYKGYYGPAGEWDNLTMAEWNACERYYADLVEGDNEHALNCFVAVLYRNAKEGYNKKLNTAGDIRQRFNPHEIDFFAHKISSWPVAVKTAVLIWFDGCREQINTTYDVFDKPSEPADKNEPGMFEVIRALCGERYGSFEEVEHLNVHIAMREIELTKKEAAELEKKYK